MTVVMTGVADTETALGPQAAAATSRRLLSVEAVTGRHVVTMTAPRSSALTPTL
jgi:hypothetical protein